MSMQGHHIHLFVREDAGLQGQAIFKSKLTFRPHSIDCATHRKVTLPLANRCLGTQKVRISPITGCDPECQCTEKIKKEDKRLESTHQRMTVICLRNKQNQQGPVPPTRTPAMTMRRRKAMKPLKTSPKGELREEQTGIYSSDSDEEAEENKSQT